MMDKNIWLKWGISGLLALASGRMALFGVMYPCPAALLTVVVNDKCSGWKTALMCAVSLWLNRRHGMAVWADVVAVAAVWLAMLALRRRKPAAATKALVGALVWTGARGLVLLRLHMLYRYGMSDIVVEAALITAVSYLFFHLYVFLQLGSMPLARPESIPVLMTVAAVLTQGILAPAASLLPGSFGQFPLVKAALFFVPLWIGYAGGAKEGALAGVTGGTLLFAMGTAAPAVTTVLACGGLAAGLCGNEAPALAAAVFSAVTLAFGLVRDGGALSLPAGVPLMAAAVFCLIPSGGRKKLAQVIPTEGEHIGYNLAARQHVLQTLEEYRKTFQYLSRAYILQRESFPGDPYVRSGRRIMAYQFKGMADAVDRLASEIRTPAALSVRRPIRFRLTVAKAGFARDAQVSGDSVYCGEVRRGTYAVALSDGMGNGRRAAEESNLTVQTVYRLLAAGFQPELALRIMNSILLYRGGDEIYSTLDLGLFDLYSGELQLYKIGGSITFLKRGDQVEAVKIPALPMGIVGDIEVPSIACRLRPGDQVMLLSDGVAEAGRNQGIQWLTETISALKSTDPQTLADLLINKAVERCGIKEKDDMTAVVVVVHER
ncbi:MAG: SpoIIE family protein phosphatase [Firmicutes bacterium]|nr:SpoIIE family protein phosphatase [Bacillota bacterium]